MSPDVTSCSMRKFLKFIFFMVPRSSNTNTFVTSVISSVSKATTLKVKELGQTSYYFFSPMNWGLISGAGPNFQMVRKRLLQLSKNMEPKLEMTPNRAHNARRNSRFSRKVSLLSGRMLLFPVSGVPHHFRSSIVKTSLNLRVLWVDRMEISAQKCCCNELSPLT